MLVIENCKRPKQIFKRFYRVFTILCDFVNNCQSRLKSTSSGLARRLMSCIETLAVSYFPITMSFYVHKHFHTYKMSTCTLHNMR